MTDYKPGDPVLVRAEIHRPPDDDWATLRINQPRGLGQTVIHADARDILPVPAADDDKVIESLGEDVEHAWGLYEQARADLAAAEARIGEALDADHIERQREWSTKTFGPGVRLGVVDHLRKELDEVEASPADLSEWADVIILGLDGAWRAGHEPQAIIDAIKAKQTRNEARSWPDWRTQSNDKAIEHDRALTAADSGEAGGE